MAEQVNDGGETAIPTHYTWGVKGSPDYLETRVDQIPTGNHFVLGQQGYRHKLGNEVAAKGVAWRKTEEGKLATDADYAEYLRKARAEMLDKIVNTKLGVRAVGAPRLTGEDAIRRAVTLESLKALLKKQNLAMPVGEETITIAGTQMNRETLIDRMYARDKAAIDAEVARRVSRDTAGSLEDLA